MFAGVHMRFRFALALASPCLVLAAVATDADQTNNDLIPSWKTKAEKAVKKFTAELAIDLEPNMAAFDAPLDTTYFKFKDWMLFKLKKTTLNLESKSALQDNDYEAKLGEKSQAALDSISQIETNIISIWTVLDDYKQSIVKEYLAEFKKRKPRFCTTQLDDCQTYIWYLEYYLEKLDARIEEYRVAYNNAENPTSSHVNDLRLIFESFNVRLDQYKWINNFELKEKHKLINFDANKILFEVQKCLKDLSTNFEIYFKLKVMYLTSSTFYESVRIHRQDQEFILNFLKEKEASKATASAADVREMQS